MPSIPAAHAAQAIPVSKYFGNTYNSTQGVTITVTNTTQIVDIRFTARYAGAVIPRVYIGIDYYLPRAEYNLLIGIQTDSSGKPSGHFLGAFVWNVSSGLCNGCGGWVSPGQTNPLNRTITLVAGSVYHIVMKYFNGTFVNQGACYGADCLLIQYIGGTNFQQESLDLHYDPNQALLSCGNVRSCAVVPDANAVYALAFNGSEIWQGQVEQEVLDQGIGAAKGGSGLNSYQGERFWMLWNTVTVDRLQVILSRYGLPTGSLNVIIWNFTAATASDILGASDPRVVLNQTLIPNLSSMSPVSDRAFNFSLAKDVTFKTGHLYQISFAIYGNTTVIGGLNEVGIEATGTDQPPYVLNWGGPDGSATGSCQQYVGGCNAFKYVGGTENSVAEENPAQDLIFIMKIVSSAVVQPISIDMSNSAPSANVSVNGCYSTPSTFPSDGKPHLIMVIPSCAFTVSFSNEANTRNGFSVSGSFATASPPQSSCSTVTCPAIQLTAYQQLRNIYEAKPAAPGTWDAGLTIAISGTRLGVAGQTGCSISTIKGKGVASCMGWFDYNTQVNVASPVAVASTERRIQSGGNNFTQTTGGNQDTVSFTDQFQVSFMVTPLGAGSTNPSGSKVWESYGSLPIRATPNGSYLFSNWSTDVGGITFASAGNASTTVTVDASGGIAAAFLAPVTQPITLTLMHQQGTPADFSLSGCSVSPSSLPGDGKSQTFTALPSCQLTITVTSDSPNVRYGFNSEDTISSTTSVTTCPEQTCPEFSATYYEQVSQQFAFNVVGGDPFYVEAPVLNFTVLGTSTTYTMTGNPTTQWLDFESSWSLVNPLPGSSGTERWFAPTGASGTATPGGEQTTTYQHQYFILIAASPADCGSAKPSGANWENSGNNFQIMSSAAPGCTFSAWESTGLITIPQPSQSSTTAFAVSNGEMTALFTRNIIPAFSTSALILIAGSGATVAMAAVIGILFMRGRRLRSRIPHE
ncbi:MAG: hypothetical protein OK474_05280 [Thaumarchaeota archaeon]|nr:hypothetical protein [Nitrososphaerota archaeon]